MLSNKPALKYFQSFAFKMDRSVRKCRKLSIFGYRRTTTTSFEMLPEVPLLKILSKLDTDDLVNMSLVSKSWNERISQIRLKNSSFWSDRIAKSTGEFWSRFVHPRVSAREFCGYNFRELAGSRLIFYRLIKMLITHNI